MEKKVWEPLLSKWCYHGDKWTEGKKKTVRQK